MSEEMILQFLRILPFVTVILMIVLLFSLIRIHPEKRILRMYDTLSGLLREKSRKSSWYHRQQKWLLRNGAGFHYGKKVQPIGFLAMRIVGALICFALVGELHLEYGILGGVGCWFLPVILLEYCNRRDNERMLGDIKLIYHTLAMQIRAGIHVTDALSECYNGIKEERLYNGLLELAGDVAMKGDVFRALEEFQSKFDNRYIDSLCITILQALESGQAVELLSDIAEQVKDMESLILERKKSRLDRNLAFYQLGILAVVLCVALYVCVGYMFSQAL